MIPRTYCIESKFWAMFCNLIHFPWGSVASRLPKLRVASSACGWYLILSFYATMPVTTLFSHDYLDCGLTSLYVFERPSVGGCRF